MSNVWRSNGSRPPAPVREPFPPQKEFDQTRGFCYGDLITFAAATVSRSIANNESMMGTRDRATELYSWRPTGDKDLSNEPPCVGIWLGMTSITEALKEWDSMMGWKATGQVKMHHYHIVLTCHGILYVHETPDRRPGMKLLSSRNDRLDR